LSFHHKILSKASPLLNEGRKIAINTNIISNDRLRVLTFHDIPPNQLLEFEAQLSHLRKEWLIISPEKFENMITGKDPINGSNLLITFDDGLISNRVVAEKVLNPMGIKAIFFIISDFASIDNHDEARQFISERIMPNSNIEDIPENWSNMQWSDLAALIEQGHTIGSHSRKHARLSEVITMEEINNEIVQSADYINLKLGSVVEHFAYPFGDLASINKAALTIASNKFKYLHTGMRGNNKKSLNHKSIRRDSTSTQNKHNEYSIFENRLLDTFLMGAADFQYKKSLQEIDSWLQ
jgi:peptidoglycan/xylan/chitin deacetylase (PgdA/CDA1 family)